jgi:pimeloyl-ACP methyl ester carboxylesterase
MASPLVCLHGLAGSSRWWSAVAPELRASGPVTLLDAPRRVGPDALEGWVAGRLATLEPPVDLVGHSLGALTAVRLAAAQPELVRRLVLVAPPGLTPRRSPLHLGLPLLSSLVQSRPRLLGTLLVDAARTGPANIMRGGAHVARADVSDRLADVSAPTLLVWGARDRLVPVAAAELWLRGIRGSRIVVLPRAAHVPMLEAPAEFVAAVAAFREERLDDPGHDPGA